VGAAVSIQEPFDQLGIEDGLAERRLWASTMQLLITDARCYWRGKRWYGSAELELEQAFDDVCRCGPMLRHLCDHLDLDPQWISEQFIKLCERDMA
jgi:hypothetical protein